MIKLNILSKNCGGLEEFLLFHAGTKVSEASPEWITAL